MDVAGNMLSERMSVPKNGPEEGSKSLLSEKGAEKLASELCRLRGAGLKLGQMLSLQDASMLPPVLANALERVRAQADIMPRKQLDAALLEAWGNNWTEKLRSFDHAPFAAASIGQVHSGVLLCGQEVAVKVQFPGVAQSIDTDLDNLQRLLKVTNLVPPGLFLENVIDFAKRELTIECDYVREAENQARFRALICGDAGMEGLDVPLVVPELSTSNVLTTHLAKGVHIDKASSLPLEVRNSIARRLLKLTLHELFIFRFMQTDPNWANFLYDDDSDMITMLDFGAAREYPKSFIDKYLDLVLASADRDEEAFIQISIDLGMLTGDESRAMLAAHLSAGFAIGEPFVSAEPYDFKGSNLTGKVKRESKVFASERLVAPPTEVYSLHRRLAGAFSTCIQLEASICCRDMLMEVKANYPK
eukprot:CAMPEP_0196589434 /NCGR_PEP_ID=MMETSP1081-20130531/63526_1 /TAXON_ID=36882 /ORGANISM="Pyramimonas amylifera, Strain CCMP720" /LENGTH=417 /DNA_ID=CAMNT_0041912233 /DNA_START=390 /DNA_END=1643 /DNA_ORIENTATION=-